MTYDIRDKGKVRLPKGIKGKLDFLNKGTKGKLDFLMTFLHYIKCCFYQG